MALNLNKETRFKVQAGYWRVTKMVFDWYLGNTQVVLSLFIDGSPNGQAGEAIEHREFFFSGEKTRQQCYELIINEPEFLQAVNA